MLSLQGPPGRRYIALAVFLVLAIFLWQGFAPSRLTLKAPSKHDIHFVPSTTDWSKARIFFPPNNTVPLPSGSPKILPRVQARAASEGKDEVSKKRKAAVRKAFVKSWNAYKEYAWGQDELMPLSGRGKTTFSGWSAQLVDALDSLWIMGLKDDFYQAVKEVAKIDWSKHDGASINVFEVTIRYLGGLLSAHDLSGEEVLLKKAVELGDALYMAFDTPNRLPTHWLSYTKATNGETTGDASISGAASGSLCVEFTRLSQITGDDKYYDATERVKKFFYEHQNHTKAPGLWPWDMDFRRGVIEDGLFTFGAGADSQYEYLPKMHALLGGLDPEYVQMTTTSLDAGRDKLLFKPMTPKDEDILMSGNLDTMKVDRSNTTQMQHLTCFVGGMYALAGKLVERKDYVDLAARLTAGCVWGYDSFPTNIMPESTELVKCETMDQPCPYEADKYSARTQENLPGGFLRVNDGRYMLRPEGIESVFYMWRVTGDTVWREAAWRMWEGIVNEAETDLAFASIQDASTKGSEKIDSMETFWLAETTKYFYLTFEDEGVINLDEWVFNTEAHPVKRPVGSPLSRDPESRVPSVVDTRAECIPVWCTWSHQRNHDLTVSATGHHTPNKLSSLHHHTPVSQRQHRSQAQPRHEARGMPFRLAARRALPAPAPTPLSRVVVLVRAHPYAQSKPPQAIFTNHLRRFHASATKCSEFAQLNHYERLGIRHDATPREVKKSFYSLSKSHHPDVNASPTAAHTFSLLSESYTVLSDPSRRAKYDADVLQLHHPHHHSHSHSHTHPPHSHYSHSHAGGRPASGLSKRRGTFRGPPPSFYRSGGWGTQSEKRRKAHDESTSSSSASTHDPWSHFSHGQGHGQGGMGPGAHPFGGRDHAPPHFDEAGHTRTHRRQDERRHERRRAMGDDDVEFEPQTSLTGHFFIVMGILAATMAAPLVYLQFMRLGRRRREGE